MGFNSGFKGLRVNSGNLLVHIIQIYHVAGELNNKSKQKLRPIKCKITKTNQELLVFERKILRRIFGPTKENQVWRVETNEELDKLIKHKNIINYIKAQRLSWFGHVQRMPDTRRAKKIFNWKPVTKRSQGRPKYRWEDNFKQDICQLNI